MLDLILGYSLIAVLIGFLIDSYNNQCRMVEQEEYCIGEWWALVWPLYIILLIKAGIEYEKERGQKNANKSDK